MLSDVHIGQEVSLEQTNGLNEYNIKIARERVKSFFERVVRMTYKERQDVYVDELILFLGGDLIEGALHLDTIMSADIKAPMTKVVEAQILIEGGIQSIKDNGGFNKITVVCVDGNHGRISHRQHFHSRRGNALEYFLYYNLAQRFPELDWVIEEGLLTYINVYDSVLRFMHGDRIAFGGINGFYTYLHRRIYEWDTSRKADHTLL